MHDFAPSIILDEVFKDIEKDTPKEMLTQQYNNIMKNAYIGNKSDGIVPYMSIFKFFDEIKKPLKEEKNDAVEENL